MSNRKCKLLKQSKIVGIQGVLVQKTTLPKGKSSAKCDTVENIRKINIIYHLHLNFCSSSTAKRILDWTVGAKPTPYTDKELIKQGRGFLMNNVPKVNDDISYSHQNY